MWVSSQKNVNLCVPRLGQLTHYVGIQSDITELVNHKKAELAAKHAAMQVSGWVGG